MQLKFRALLQGLAIALILKHEASAEAKPATRVTFFFSPRRRSSLGLPSPACSSTFRNVWTAVTTVLDWSSSQSQCSCEDHLRARSVNPRRIRPLLKERTVIARQSAKRHLISPQRYTLFTRTTRDRRHRPEPIKGGSQHNATPSLRDRLGRYQDAASKTVLALPLTFAAFRMR